MRKNATERLKDLLEDERLSEQQKIVLRQWAKHLKTYKTDQQVLDIAYTMREFGLFIKKPFEYASEEEIKQYMDLKRESKESITGRRLLPMKGSSVKGYRYRINSFYRWVMKHTNYTINPELAYPKPKIIRKPEKSGEFLCKQRVLALLRNEIITTNRKEDRGLTQDELKRKYPHLLLDEANLKILNDLYDYKITSGKVVSHVGFVTKIYFLKRLGQYLHKSNKTYKDAKREDIQTFLSEIQKGVSDKNGHKDRTTINSSYKAHILDFYRYLYGMFEEEQPRKYPDVVSWLYQKRKKGNDKLAKEIIPDSEIKAMIESCSETRDKALISLLADCSARIGEIINCRIEDIKINEIELQGAEYSHSIATIVLRGKTGERTNQLFYSVPHLRLWLMNHPLKNNPKAPLFVSTKECRYGLGLTQVGANGILKRSARKAGIKRHIHAHLFRHTNLTRMARLLSETELKIHAGWGSNSKMADVYVHLNEKDVANKILEKYGIVNKNEENQANMFEFKFCPNTICNYQNPSEAKFCLKCGYPLSLKTAVSLTKIKKQEDELQRELFQKDISNIAVQGDIKEALYQTLKTDPRLIEKLKDIMAMVAEVEK